MPNEPSLWELKHLIERNHADNREDYLDLKSQVGRDFAAISAQMERFLLRDVYEAREQARNAEKEALERRVGELETEQKTTRNMIRTAIYAAVGSVVASVVAGVVLAVLLKGK